MKQYHFSVVVEKDADGYFVMCPELQGCYSQGDSYEEAMGEHSGCNPTPRGR